MTNRWLFSTRMCLAPDTGGGAAPSSGPSGGASPSSGSVSSGTTPASPASSSPASPPIPGGGDMQPASPSEAGEAPDIDFGALFGDGPLTAPPDLGGEAPAAAVPPAQPTTAPPVAAAPAPAQTQPPVGSETTPPPSGVSDRGSPQAGEAPALDPYDPTMLAEHLSKSEPQAIQFVAEQMFKLSPAEIEAVEQDVIGTIPMLLAKVFVKSQQNVLQQLGRMIPVMVQRHTQAMARNSQGEDQFYAAWPQIDKATHKGLVDRYATVYRQMHPQATLDQLIADLGPMIMMAARIPPGNAAAGPPARRPAAPAGNGRPPPPSPFVPAGGQAGPVAQSKASELEPWEAMFRNQ